MTSDHAETTPTWLTEDDVPVDELARRQGVRPVRSVGDMTRPDLFESDQEWDAFLADLYASRQTDRA